MLIKILFFLNICVICSASLAGQTCYEIFSLRPPLSAEFTYQAFNGYQRDSVLTAEKLNYPTAWTYRKIGGGRSDLLHGEALRGSTSNTYRAEKENGDYIILKEYRELEDLARDFRAYEHLASVLKSRSRTSFLVPKTTRSRRNPFVLEIEYFSGVDFETFLVNNKENKSLFKMIEQYNRNVAQLSASLSSEVFDPVKVVDSSKLKTVMAGNIDNFFIWLNASNVLIVKSDSQPSGFDFVIIDPE